VDLFFDSKAGQLPASTTDSRLHTIDIATGDLVPTVPFDGVETYNLAVRPDGLVVVISTGSPSRIELVDRELGPLRAESLEFSNLAGAILRTDGAALIWDFTIEVNVVDLEARLFVDQSFVFDAIVGSRGVPNMVRRDRPATHEPKRLEPASVRGRRSKPHSGRMGSAGARRRRSAVRLRLTRTRFRL